MADSRELPLAAFDTLPPASSVVDTVRRFARRKPLGAFSFCVIVFMVFIALFGEFFAPHSYDDIDVPSRLTAPNLAHPAGTDAQGRDQFSRLIYGANTSVLIGFGTVLVSGFIATTLGIISGYKSGWFDTVVQRIVDIWQAFPGLIFVIFVVAIFGASRITLIFTMGLLFSAGASRLVRGATMAVSSEAYIEAARALGATDLRIWVQHVLPNVVPVIIISMTVQVGGAILLESSLSFLGFGTPPPFPSWGRMLNDAQSHMTSAPYLAVFPGIAIALAVYAFNMFGDALRDVLDPRLRGSR
ncbi:MAG: ABC transporter permease [Dehalococcoidia bacterium]